MDLNEIYNLIQAEGGKFIIVENGKPILVVTSFDDYQKRYNKNNESNLAGVDKYQSDQQQKVVFAPQKDLPMQLPKELEEEPLKIEDLPI